MCKLTNSK